MDEKGIIIQFGFIALICTAVFLSRTKSRWTKGHLPNNLPFNKKNLLLVYASISIGVIKFNPRAVDKKTDAIYDFIKKRNDGSLPFLFSVYYSYLETKPIHPNEGAKWLQKFAKDGTKEVLVKFLIRLSLLDGTLTDKEVQVLKMIATTLAISPPTFEKWLIAEEKNVNFNSTRQNNQSRNQQHAHQQQYSGRKHVYSSPTPSLRSQHAKTLGLNEYATDEEIKLQYRKLVKQHHPDRFARSSKEEQERAHKRFLEIQHAYDFLSN